MKDPGSLFRNSWTVEVSHGSDIVDAGGFMRTVRTEIVTLLAVLIAMLLLFGGIYLRLMPSINNTIGDDYSLHFPNLLSGYYWYLNNGLFSIPWFSPSQCGGVPFFADPNVGYYSVPQLLTFLVSPLLALQITFVIFAMMGFLGAYSLMRISFRASMPATLLAATLFMFNGFYAHRMLAGHLTYHSFMLLPVLASAMLPPPNVVGVSVSMKVLRVGIAALCFAYMFQSGMVHIIPPALLAFLVIWLLYALIFGWSWFPLLSLLVAGLLALAISASKLTAELAFLSNFPRDNYPLPGIREFPALATLAFRMLFFSVPERISGYALGALVGRHEWEYSVSPAPLLFILGAILAFIPRIRRWPVISLYRVVLSGAIILLLLIPLVLNWYQPTWNALLKGLPYFANSVTLFRWFSAYILVAVLLGALALDRLPLSATRLQIQRAVCAALGIGIMLAANYYADWSYYHRQYYWITPIETGYAEATATHSVPPITRIAVEVINGKSSIQSVLRGNDVLIEGYSQLRCYQPLFGYWLENFPVETLHVGSAMDRSEEYLNVKNPACYLFPRDNDCKPGDHFRSTAVEQAQAFLRYEPFPFGEPSHVHVAGFVSVVAFTAVVAAIFGACVGFLSSKLLS